MNGTLVIGILLVIGLSDTHRLCGRRLQHAGPTCQ